MVKELDLTSQKWNATIVIKMDTLQENNALIAQDGIGGYDWSYQAEEEQPTNYALMAFTSSGSSSSSDSEVDSCSKTCVKAYATLKEQHDNLSSDNKNSQFNLVSYKAGLESVKARLAHKKNEVVFEENINVLKLEVRLRDNALDEYKMKLEKAEKERDQLKQTLEKFQNSSKSLNDLLESQVIDKFKTGLGYNAATAASPAVESFVNLSDKSGSDKGYHSVPPPLTGNFIPRKPDLTFIDEIVESENMDVTTVVTPSNDKTVENKGVSNTVESNAVRMNNSSAPIIEDWNSDDESEVEPNDKTVRPSTEKIKSIKTVRETDAPKQNKHHPRGNQRNWNNLMSQRLGSDFKMINKACFVCGSFEHLHYVCDKKVVRPVWNNSRRVNHKNFSNKMTHPYPKRSFVPQAVLIRTNKINTDDANVNTTGASINTVIRPINIVASTPIVNHSRPKSNAFKRGYSQSSRPFNRYYANKNNIINTNVNIARVKNTTARDRTVGNPQQKEYKEKAVIDSGCSSVDLKSVVPTGGLTCLIAKATIDESNTWHKRLGHINFKTMNKLVKGNLVKGLPSKIFENDHSCVACQKGKQHKASYKTKAKAVNTACYVLNRVLVIKPHNKTPYKHVYGIPPLIDFMKPFGYPINILNTRDHLGKFNGRVVTENQTNGIAGTKDNIVAGPKDSEGDAGMKPTEVDERGASDKNEKDAQDTRSDTPVSTTGPSFDNDVPSLLVNTPGPFVSTANAFKEHLIE
ncbi:ribonuclease H-like domain-containing protein [Tanacetum coccineum]